MLLFEIISIILCPSATKDLLIYLRSLIDDHHRLFKEVFPERNLVAKHHLLVHYPTCLAQAGPACRYWCMRFEAKHWQMKQCATSFLNVCKTVASKHQEDQCIEWNTDKSPFDEAEVQTSDGMTVRVDTLNFGDEVVSKIGIDKYDEVSLCVAQLQLMVLNTP